MSSFEQLSEKLDEGYLYGMQKNIMEATNSWNDAWRVFIALVDENGSKTLEDFDSMVNGNMYVRNWVMDLERLLQEATKIDFNYHKLIIKICSEYLKRFDDTGAEDVTQLYRISFCASLFALGEESKSEEYYKLWLKKDPNWTAGWLGWSDCWIKFTEVTKKDLKNAASILNLALEEKSQRGGKTAIYDKLIWIYEKLKDKEMIEKVKMLKKDTWGEELSE